MVASSALSAPSSADGSSRNRRSTSEQAQLRERCRGGAPAGHLEAPGEEPARSEREDEQHEVDRDVLERRATEGARHDAREQRRLDEDDAAAAATSTPAASSPPGAMQQARIERTHASRARSGHRSRSGRTSVGRH